MNPLAGTALLAAAAWLGTSASAQLAERPPAAGMHGRYEEEPDEPAAVIGIGAATGWDIHGGAAAFGPNVSAEFTPIEHWLEIEGGTTPLFTSHSTEWDTDLVFKRPWTLSPHVEFMAGAGPEWVHTREDHVTTDMAAIEAVTEFMIWPSPRRRFGLYIEPAYDYGFGHDHEQSIGVSAGLLIGIHHRHR